MKKTLLSVVAAFALTLTSAAFAQSAPSDKAPPPPSGSTGSDSTVSPPNGSETNRTDTAKKSGKTKQGADSNGDKQPPSKY